MDIDISDLLASVSRPPASGPPTPYLTDSSAQTDHQLLVRAWTTERCAPELLPYPSTLLQRVMHRIQAQIARIEDLAAGAGSLGEADGGGGGGGSGGGIKGHNVNLVLSVLQTDLSRTQFLVRALLRCRLAKIGAWAGFYGRLAEEGEEGKAGGDHAGLGGESAVSTRAGGLLSEAEAGFLRKRQALLAGLYEASFLGGFPAKLKRLDDGGVGEGGMLEGPDRGVVVVVRCLVAEWGNGEELEREVEGVGVELSMRRGECWVVRWGDVRKGVVDGALEAL
jgi:GINS complex subunit 4